MIGDIDQDGLPDWLESGPDDAPRDANSDGTPDHLQPSVGSLPPLFSEAALALEIPAGRFLAFGVTGTGVDDPLPERVVLDAAFTSFRGSLTHPPVGQPGAFEIRVHLPPLAHVPDQIWAHNPAAAPDARWIDVTPMAVLTGSQLRFLFVDGMAYDLDGRNDGTLEMTLALGRRLPHGPVIGEVESGPAGEIVVKAQVGAGWPCDVLASDDLQTWISTERKTSPTGHLQLRLPLETHPRYIKLREVPR